MTNQTPTATPATTAQPAPTGGSAAAVASRASRALGLTGRGGATTPRRLGLARLVLVGIALLLGVGSAVTAAQLGQRESLAEVHAAQYVRITTVETHLLTAQAAAARASLSGGDGQREEVSGALDQAATLLVEVAAAQTDDPAELASISHDLRHYSDALGRALLQRDSAAGRTALTGADAILHDDLLPAVQQLQAAHGAVSTSGVAWWMWLLPVGAWLGVAAIVGVAWFVARMSHRIINPGLAIAAIATLVLAISSGSLIAGHADPDTGSVGGAFSHVESLTKAQRSTAGAAALLANGVATQSWTSQDSELYASLLDTADAALDPVTDPGVSARLDTFRAAAAITLAHAEAAEWDDAATSLVADSGEHPAPAAAGFLAQVAASIDDALSDLSGAIRLQSGQTVGFAVLAVVCAVVSAVASAWGLQQRLKEYR